MRREALTWSKKTVYLRSGGFSKESLAKSHFEKSGFTLPAENLTAPLGEALTGETAFEIEVPDLSQFPDARERAVFLLQTAAEIEHALLVQYLYAAFSLGKPPFQGQPPANAASLVEKWRRLLLKIAREEMGHFITVQNLLRLISGELNFEREDFPFRKDYYPFPFTLEPLSTESLAKYVAAEMPELPDPPPVLFGRIPEIIGIATANAGMTVNRVGVLYALLIAIFSRPEEIAAPSRADAFNLWVSLVHKAAMSAFSADERHLDDDDFLSDTLSLQARREDWGGDSELHVFVAANREQAIEALREIALQGEGPPPEQMSLASHFGGFYRTYLEFPHHGEWIPVRNAAKNPVLPQSGVQTATSTITHPRSQNWAKLFNLRYAMMLFSLMHFLKSEGDLYVSGGVHKGDRTPRGYLHLWAFDEMRRIGKIGIKLSRLPRFEDDSDPARAGAPFTLPPVLELPDAETARWMRLLDYFKQSLNLLETMFDTGSVDENDPFLRFLLASDLKSFDIARSQVEGVELPPQPTEFQKVVHILDEAVRGFLIQAHGAFWRDVKLTDFLNARPIGLPLLVVGNSGQSNLARVLEEPDEFFRMPMNRPAVPPSRIEFIKEWIDRNCPDNDPPGSIGIISEPNPLD